MNFSELIESLKVTLKTPLLATEYDSALTHFTEIRKKSTPDPTYKKSGVLLFFYPINNDPHLLLIKRSTYKGAHSGQVSFPGGKAEKTDRDIIHTAIREAEEEVAIIAPQILGQLTDVYVPVSQFNITPVVGYADTRPEFIPEKREVDSILEFPLNSLLQNELFEFGKVRLSSNVNIKTYYFSINEHIVWGATAMIIAELRSYLLRNFD